VSTLQQDRYGRQVTPGRRRLLVAAGGVLFIAALALVAWLSLFGGDSVHWDDIGYHVVSDSQVEVTFDVNFSGGAESGTRPPTAVCTLQALNALRTEVGLRDVTVQAGPSGRVRATTSLKTSERASTALVKSCTPAP
jgi:hypothetical protein